jgi:PAS domain S-box-containing protein
VSTNPLLQHQKILLIEDDPGDAVYFQTLMRHAGLQNWTVKHVLNLNEGIRTLETFQASLILLDLSLPDSWGIDTILRFQAQSGHVPIVVISGLEDEQMALEAVRKGAEDYLLKGQVDHDLLKRTLFYAIERYRLKQEMIHSEKRLLSIIHRSLDGILVVDENGIVVFANPSVEMLLGRPMSEIVHNPFGYSVDGHVSYELKVKQSQGVELTLDVKAIPFEWDRKDAHLVMIRDISERKNVERLKNEFTSYITHAMKAPLRLIEESTSEMIEHVTGDDRQKLYTISENVHRMKQMSENLMQISKLEEGQVELYRKCTNIIELFESVSEHFKTLAQQKGIELTFQAAADEITALIDQNQIRQVIYNLIDNAIKFTHEGSVLVLVTETEDQVECIIEDTGIGIDRAHLSKIFNKIEQTRRDDQSFEFGFGLGLTIAKGIIELHQGKIFVDSQPNAGTRVTVVLPKFECTYKHQGVRKVLTSAIEKYTMFSIAIFIIDGLQQASSADQDRVMEFIHETIRERLNRDHDKVIRDKSICVCDLTRYRRPKCHDCGETNQRLS